MKNKLKNAYSTCMECGGTKMKKGGNWIKKAVSKNPGSFTAQAKRAGMSTSSFRDKVLANKEKFSSTTVKRANLAKTLSGMRKGEDGMLTDEKNRLNMSSSRDVQWQSPKDNAPTNPALQPKSNSWYTEEQWDKGMQSRPSNFVSNSPASKYNLVRGGTDKVATYQEMLNKKLGLNLKVDGAWGPATQAAYEKYKKMSATNSNSSKNWYTTKQWDDAVSKSKGTSTPSSKSWYTTEQWDNAVRSQSSNDGLPSVNLPTSSGIKRNKSMRKGGLTNASMVSGSTKLPKKGQSFAKRKTTTPRFTLK
jgi:hypothetical protein